MNDFPDRTVQCNGAPRGDCGVIFLLCRDLSRKTNDEAESILLVGDLDPKSNVRLEREREIAQVTAEKDHLEGVQLVRGFTEIASKTWRAKDHAPTADTTAQAAPANAGEFAQSNTALPTPAPTRARPIPRPAKIEPQKPGLLDRLFGRK